MDGLERFVCAQQRSYLTALQEIKSGRKQSHWIWFIFPQIAGLGHSEMSHYYAIKDINEAKEYMANETLRKNLLEISQVILELDSDDAVGVMGGRTDAMKLKSSMTLFALAEPECEVFQKVLDKFFGGKMDRRTKAILERQQKA